MSTTRKNTTRMLCEGAIMVALALVLGLAVFPAVKIYRLYFPLEEVSK